MVNFYSYGWHLSAFLKLYFLFTVCHYTTLFTPVLFCLSTPQAKRFFRVHHTSHFRLYPIGTMLYTHFFHIACTLLSSVSFVGYICNLRLDDATCHTKRASVWYSCSLSCSDAFSLLGAHCRSTSNVGLFLRLQAFVYKSGHFSRCLTFVPLKNFSLLTTTPVKVFCDYNILQVLVCTSCL